MNTGIDLSSSIRTNCSEVLSRKISLVKMHNSLIDLFVDRTEVDTTLRRFMDDESLNKSMQYSRCKSSNDDHDSYSCDGDDVDSIKYDLFIPRDDAQ